MSNISCSTKPHARLLHALRDIANTPLRLRGHFHKLPDVVPFCGCKSLPKNLENQFETIRKGVDTTLDLAACGLKDETITALQGARVKMVRRDPTFAMIEFDGFRYYLPYSVFEGEIKS